ncbi:MAG TPA: GNAT family N-acetyltransferase [Dermatophilaceae bacterium]|nr:GNAT family N-acetyltransferase [Dermatophilaceae bacterium]
MDVQLVPVDPLSPAHGQVFADWLGVHSAASRHTFGEGASIWAAEEVRAMHGSDAVRRLATAAREPGGAVVGALEVMLPLRDNLSVAEVWLSVLPARRRHGVGSTLLHAAEQQAREHHRTVLRATTEWRAGADDTSGEGFARTKGYAVAQTALRSRLPLPAPREALESMLARNPGDYAIETSWDGIPDAWLEDRAHLSRRMSTDIPLDELVAEEEDWDAERLRAKLEREREAGRLLLEAVVRHLPTGRLVGHTDLAVTPPDRELAYQLDTFVLDEHRGHGLGLRLKAANLLALMDGLPEVAAVRTWNAQENEHMLAVNRRLGFEVDGYERAWQKIVAVPG